MFLPSIMKVYTCDSREPDARPVWPFKNTLCTTYERDFFTTMLQCVPLHQSGNFKDKNHLKMLKKLISDGFVLLLKTAFFMGFVDRKDLLCIYTNVEFHKIAK